VSVPLLSKQLIDSNLVSCTSLQFTVYSLQRSDVCNYGLHRPNEEENLDAVIRFKKL
jgi:hypothetical protein